MLSWKSKEIPESKFAGRILTHGEWDEWVGNDLTRDKISVIQPLEEIAKIRIIKNFYSVIYKTQNVLTDSPRYLLKYVGVLIPCVYIFIYMQVPQDS